MTNQVPDTSANTNQPDSREPRHKGGAPGLKGSEGTSTPCS